ncbi:MAG: glycosyltransferase family 4 protein [Pirellulaceae bacterium]|nr:glycosyltransferase family 4 protein [Planctomycetales bacterium]
MRILAIYRHYWPDTTPYARILRTILEHQVERGHEVHVITAQPGYNDIQHARQPWRESLGGVDVHRIRLLPERKSWRLLRSFNFAWFLLRATLHAVWARNYDVIVANSHPPVLMGIVLRIIKGVTGIPYIYHCQDLHPESAQLGGQLRAGFIYQQLLGVDAQNCRQAQRVVVLSDDMWETIEGRGVETENVSVINNPPLDVGDGPSLELPSIFHDPEAFYVLFAGNLGIFQGLDVLVKAVRFLPQRVPVRLIFMGEGLAKPALMEEAGLLLDERIFFLPHQPVEVALAAMREADLGVVSLLPEIYRFAFPSKSMMYLSAGCPLLTIMEPDSELAKVVREYRLGYVANRRWPQIVANLIEQAWRERHTWTAARRAEIQEVCDALYGRDRMLSQWDRVLSVCDPEANREFTPAEWPKVVQGDAPKHVVANDVFVQQPNAAGENLTGEEERRGA